MIPNRPTAEGREAGRGIARMADNAALVFGDTRCGTCAFRSGTVPNGCVSTIMDAMKCIMERVEFRCHEDLTKRCGGYDASMKATAGMPRVKVPWPFSDEIEDSPYEETKGKA